MRVDWKRRGGAAGEWSQSHRVFKCFQEERGVAGQLLLNKPWPLSIRPEELIRHETGQSQVRNEGH